MLQSNDLLYDNRLLYRYNDYYVYNDLSRLLYPCFVSLRLAGIFLPLCAFVPSMSVLLPFRSDVLVLYDVIVAHNSAIFIFDLITSMLL